MPVFNKIITTSPKILVPAVLIPLIASGFIVNSIFIKPKSTIKLAVLEWSSVAITSSSSVSIINSEVGSSSSSVSSISSENKSESSSVNNLEAKSANKAEVKEAAKVVQGGFDYSSINPDEIINYLDYNLNRFNDLDPLKSFESQKTDVDRTFESKYAVFLKFSDKEKVEFKKNNPLAHAKLEEYSKNYLNKITSKAVEGALSNLKNQYDTGQATLAKCKQNINYEYVRLDISGNSYLYLANIKTFGDNSENGLRLIAADVAAKCIEGSYSVYKPTASDFGKLSEENKDDYVGSFRISNGSIYDFYYQQPIFAQPTQAVGVTVRTGGIPGSTRQLISEQQRQILISLENRGIELYNQLRARNLNNNSAYPAYSRGLENIPADAFDTFVASKQQYIAESEAQLAK